MSIPVAWGDMDAFGHVNNVVYFRWFETGRMSLFSEIGVTLRDIDEGCGPILAQTSCSFRKPVTFPDTVTVHTSISRIGTKSFGMLYRIQSEALDDTVAEGEGALVWYDYAKGETASIPADLRARLQAHIANT
ncbi:MAG: acyl-CoA thioesterase [Nannocystaceae bacterium]|nr:acyl-CoA thioesterase [bacterium]